MINELPTILEVVDAAEVVTDAAKKQVEEKSKSNSIAVNNIFLL
jgi:PII-like signaling protein